MEAIALERVCVAPVTRRARQPEPNRAPGVIKRLWLQLYAEGGTWTEAEIRTRLHLCYSLQSTLRELASRGFLARSKVTNVDGEVSIKYGVTRRCKVPRGVTVDEMWVILQETAEGGGK